jgi:5-methyltetrahydropteroyltriglutamate--homocysteine methyltransferase
MLYPIATIKNYSHQQFLADLINESEKDIRMCLEHGAECVQIDFTEANFSFQVDPTGQLLRDFIRFNNRVLNRFRFSEQHRLGVNLCLSLYTIRILRYL